MKADLETCIPSIWACEEPRCPKCFALLGDLEGGLCDVCREEVDAKVFDVYPAKDSPVFA